MQNFGKSFLILKFFCFLITIPDLIAIFEVMQISFYCLKFKINT